MGRATMQDPRTTRVGELQPGQYADGSPLHDIQYLECKLILKTVAAARAAPSSREPKTMPSCAHP